MDFAEISTQNLRCLTAIVADTRKKTSSGCKVKQRPRSEIECIKLLLVVSFFHPSLRIRIILYTPKKQRIVCFLLEKKSSLPRRQFFFRMLYLSIDDEIVVKIISGRGWCNCTIDRKADKRSTCCRAYHFTVSARALCQHTIAASGKLNRILILNTFFLGRT